MASRKAKQSETIEKEGTDNREGEEDEATTSSHCASRRAVLVFLRTSCWAGWGCSYGLESNQKAWNSFLGL
ncbi:hypothetical protein HZH66_011135 [Vespula vulgaris]|uniref:Uncharacterized protein n=1 Tax=Vespula vulgaris TaxID=7454 RepID=A0A834JDL3_VESVU|nr:hypothetical protein HZH66_011135 [Vespula vulgaris]